MPSASPRPGSYPVTARPTRPRVQPVPAQPVVTRLGCALLPRSEALHLLARIHGLQLSLSTGAPALAVRLDSGAGSLACVPSEREPPACWLAGVARGGFDARRRRRQPHTLSLSLVSPPSAGRGLSTRSPQAGPREQCRAVGIRRRRAPGRPETRHAPPPSRRSPVRQSVWPRPPPCPPLHQSSESLPDLSDGGETCAATHGFSNAASRRRPRCLPPSPLLSPPPPNFERPPPTSPVLSAHPVPLPPCDTRQLRLAEHRPARLPALHAHAQAADAWLACAAGQGPFLAVDNQPAASEWPRGGPLERTAVDAPSAHARPGVVACQDTEPHADSGRQLVSPQASPAALDSLARPRLWLRRRLV